MTATSGKRIGSVFRFRASFCFTIKRANFVLPAERAIRVRVIAPFSVRAENVANQFGVPLREAERRITRTDSNRKSFVRKYFNADISAPGNYDLIINTGAIDLGEATAMICAAARHRLEACGSTPDHHRDPSAAMAK